MKKLTDILGKKKFTISVEIVPVRNGEDIEVVLDKVSKLKKAGVDFISVTKSAMGSLRGGTLPVSHIVKQKYDIDTIAHFTCREQDQQQVENELIDHHYLGVKNILALRGDPPIGVKEKEWAGCYRYAWQLVKQIKDMNTGRYIPREGFDKGEFREGIKTDFCIGVASHPEDDIETEIRHLKAKVDAGAEFAVTQMIFDADRYADFVKKANDAGINIPILPGLRPVLSYKQCEFIENIFGVKTGKKFREHMKSLDKDKAKEYGVKYTVELVRKLKKAGAPGVHFFIINNIDLAVNIITQIN